MKAVLFDLDGTLIDSSEGITKSVQYALDCLGIGEQSFETLRKFIGHPLVQSFMDVFHFSREKAEEAVEAYRARYREIGVYECCLYPDVQECIDVLFDEVVGAMFDGRINSKEEVLRFNAAASGTAFWRGRRSV